jgi:hypothetical protein
MQNSKRGFFFLLICGFLFTNCNWLKKQPKTPEEVTLKFVRALEVLDIDLAASYCDSATNVLFEGFKNSLAAMPVETREETAAKMKLIQQSTCEITNNTASCVLCCVENNQNVPERLFLRLIDNKWQISLIPNDNNGRMEDASPPAEVEVNEEPPAVE